MRSRWPRRRSVLSEKSMLYGLRYGVRKTVDIGEDHVVRADSVVSVLRKETMVGPEIAFEVRVEYAVGRDSAHCRTVFSPRTHNQPRAASTRLMNRVRAAMEEA